MLLFGFLPDNRFVDGVGANKWNNQKQHQTHDKNKNPYLLKYFHDFAPNNFWINDSLDGKKSPPNSNLKAC
jgi:hypothetical protein